MSWSFQYPVCQVELAVKSIVSPLNARLTVMEKACHRSSSSSLVVVVSVGSVSMGVVVLEEDGLVGKVTSKGDSGDTETRERALESVPAREGAGVSPGLAVGLRQRERSGQRQVVWTYYLAQGSFRGWPEAAANF